MSPPEPRALVPTHQRLPSMSPWTTPKPTRIDALGSAPREVKRSSSGRSRRPRTATPRRRTQARNQGANANSSASDRAKPMSRFNAPNDPADVAANRTANAKRASSQLPDHRGATWCSRPGRSEPQLGRKPTRTEARAPFRTRATDWINVRRPTRSCDVAIARLHNVDRVELADRRGDESPCWSHKPRHDATTDNAPRNQNGVATVRATAVRTPETSASDPTLPRLDRSPPASAPDLALDPGGITPAPFVRASS